MLFQALFVCLIVFLIILIAFYTIGKITFWSSFAIASLLALIILLLMYPPILLIAEAPNYGTMLYIFLVFVFVIVIFFYVISKAVNDIRSCRKNECKGRCDETNHCI